MPRKAANSTGRALFMQASFWVRVGAGTCKLGYAKAI
jgi:hypothetical protein